MGEEFQDPALRRVIERVYACQSGTLATMCTHMSTYFRSAGSPDENANTAEQYLTVHQTARLLSVHPSTIRRWIDRGILPAYRIGPKRIAVRQSDLDAASSPRVLNQESASAPRLPPLAPWEQKLWKQAIQEAKVLQAELLEGRGGNRFDDSGILINEARDQRTRVLAHAPKE